MRNDYYEHEDWDSWIDEAIDNLPSQTSLGTAIDLREIMEQFTKDYSLKAMCDTHKWFGYDWASWIESVVDNLPDASVGDAIELETRLRCYAASHSL